MNTVFGWHMRTLDREPGYDSRYQGAAILKAVGSPGDMAILKSWFERYGSGRIYSGRVITLEDAVRYAHDHGGSSVLAAQQWIDAIASIVAEHGLSFVWWETFCMPGCDSWYMSFNKAAVLGMAAKHLKVIALNFSQGYPQVAPFAKPDDPDQWPMVYEVLQAIHDVGPAYAKMGLHLYQAGGSFSPADESTALRLKPIYKYHIDPHGWDIQTVGTEGGFDSKAYFQYPGHTVDGWLAQIEAMDKAFAAFPRLLAVALYSLDDRDDPFNLTGPCFEALQPYLAANPAKPVDSIIPAPTPSPTPAPIPSPSPGRPVIAFVDGAKCKALNFREGPGVEYTILRPLPAGEQVHVWGPGSAATLMVAIGRAGWVVIMTASGDVGYCAASYLAVV